MNGTPNRRSDDEIVLDAYSRIPMYKTFWATYGYRPKPGVIDLSQVPIITKDIMREFPLHDRMTLLPTDYFYFPAISGGTTASPTVSLVSKYIVPSYYSYLTKNIETYSAFLLRPVQFASAMLGGTIASSFFKPGTLVSLGDSKDISGSATLAKEVQVDFLQARVSDAVRMATALSSVGYDPGHIRVLWLIGEPLTYAAMAVAKKKYPNARILISYAMTEVPAIIGIRSSLCTSIENIGTNAYHLNTEDYVVEVVNESLVVTARHIIPTPIVRFDTGDNAIIIEDHKCSCGLQGNVVQIGPRRGLEAYKIGGYSFNVEKVSAALSSVGDFVSNDFLLRIEQSTTNDQLTTELYITCKPNHEPTEFVKSVVSDALHKRLIVAGTLSLEKAEKTGRIKLAQIVFDKKITGASILPPKEMLLADS